MNILYISYDGMTDNLGQSQVIPYLIGLSKKGYSFTLLSCEKKSSYYFKKDTIQKILKQHNINWEPIFYTKKPPLFSTLYDIVKLRFKAFSLHRKLNFKAVHCRSYIPSIIGLSLKRTTGIKLIFDMRGFWADERVDGNIWNQKNILFKNIFNYFKKLEKDFLFNSDAIISLTHAGKQKILSWNNITLNPNKITVIPCSADFDLFQLVTPGNKKNIRQKLNINQSDFVLTYLGSIGTWYMLNEMLDFFIQLKKHFPPSVFLFITTDDEANIKQIAIKKSLDSSNIIVRKANRNEVPEYLSASDWGISFIKPSYSKISSSPTKLGEMLAMGIPLICNEGVGDVKQIIEETDGGVTINEFNKVAYEAAIEKIKLSIITPQETRQKAFKIYSLENAVNEYYNVYQTILK
jgi:glycosyltransferase involved in cell wall biosynthesis